MHTTIRPVKGIKLTAVRVSPGRATGEMNLDVGEDGVKITEPGTTLECTWKDSGDAGETVAEIQTSAGASAKIYLRGQYRRIVEENHLATLTTYELGSSRTFHVRMTAAGKQYT